MFVLSVASINQIEEPREENVYSVWGINFSQTIVTYITIQGASNKFKKNME